MNISVHFSWGIYLRAGLPYNRECMCLALVDTKSQPFECDPRSSIDIMLRDARCFIYTYNNNSYSFISTKCFTYKIQYVHQKLGVFFEYG